MKEGLVKGRQGLNAMCYFTACHWHRLWRLFLVLVITACVPAIYGTYYKPGFADHPATLLPGDCYFQAGPLSIIEIGLPHGKIRLGMKTNYKGDDWDLFFWLKISNASSFRFLSNVFRFKDMDSGREWSMRKDTLRISQNNDQGLIASGEVIAPEKLLPATIGHFTGWHLVRVEATIPDFTPPDELIVHLPAVIVEGHKYVIRPFRVRSDRKADEKNWSYTWPKLIVGDLTISGKSFEKHSYYIDGPAAPHLNNYLNIYFSPRLEWRFASYQIAVENPETGSVVKAPFIVQFQFAMSTPFTSNLHGSFFSLERFPMGLVNSGQLPKRVILILPPVRVDGDRIDLPPIIFERHGPEPGLGPFNC